MAIERPTFSESWHRVANLHPRLRSAVRNYRQFYRGRMWHVLADQTNNQFFRLDEPAYRFIALLDGQRNVAEAWRIVSEDQGDRAPTQGEAIQLLGQLYTANLIQADLPPDSAQMFVRYRRRVQREVGSYLTNFLFIRLPLFDPQPLLKATVKLVGWAFSPIGFLLWLAMIFTGLYFVAGHWEELINAASPQSMLNAENLALLYLTFAGIKAIHEFGHGYACAHFGRISGIGGPVHTIGIMFLVFMPVPYVDASSSWAFRNKWHRAIVGAGGMYFELAVAAIAAIIWSQTTVGSVIHDIAFNAMFIASVSTLLFNANPLLRYDGYYILSDILEIANLAQRSRQYLFYLGKRYVFGIKRARSLTHSVSEKWWLTIYGIASFAYRVLICFGILLYVANIFPLLGAFMAAGAIATWVIFPICKFIKFLVLGEELERVRFRAVAVSAAITAVIAVLVGVIRWPDRGRADGVIEPVRITMINARADGFVKDALPSGQWVEPQGGPLLVAENMSLETEYRQVLADLKAETTRRELARNEDPAVAAARTRQIESLNIRRKNLQERLAGLRIQAPFKGQWVSDEAEHIKGAYVKRGQRLGLVADPTELIIRATADQSLGPRIEPEIGRGPDTRVEIRVAGRPDIFMTGTIEDVLPAGQNQLPSAALGYIAGGSIRVNLQDSSGTSTAEPFFEVRIRPDAQAAKQLYSGQRVVVRFDMPPKPIAVQVWRSFLRLIQRRFSVPA